LFGDVAACREMACVLFVVQTVVYTTNSTHAVSQHVATYPRSIQRHNFTDYFDRNI